MAELVAGSADERSSFAENLKNLHKPSLSEKNVP